MLTDENAAPLLHSNVTVTASPGKLDVQKSLTPRKSSVLGSPCGDDAASLHASPLVERLKAMPSPCQVGSPLAKRLRLGSLTEKLDAAAAELPMPDGLESKLDAPAAETPVQDELSTEVAECESPGNLEKYKTTIDSTTQVLEEAEEIDATEGEAEVTYEGEEWKDEATGVVMAYATTEEEAEELDQAEGLDETEDIEAWDQLEVTAEWQDPSGALLGYAFSSHLEVDEEVEEDREFDSSSPSKESVSSASEEHVGYGYGDASSESEDAHEEGSSPEESGLPAWEDENGVKLGWAYDDLDDQVEECAQEATEDGPIFSYELDEASEWDEMENPELEYRESWFDLESNAILCYAADKTAEDEADTSEEAPEDEKSEVAGSIERWTDPNRGVVSYERGEDRDRCWWESNGAIMSYECDDNSDFEHLEEAEQVEGKEEDVQHVARRRHGGRLRRKHLALRMRRQHLKRVIKSSLFRKRR